MKHPDEISDCQTLTNRIKSYEKTETFLLFSQADCASFVNTDGFSLARGGRLFFLRTQKSIIDQYNKDLVNLFPFLKKSQMQTIQ
jgi:hypothetical protein